MKRVKPIVLYDSGTNQIYNLTVLTTVENVPLIRYIPNEHVQPYKYPTFKALYTSILSILKTNDFYTRKWIECDCTFYDIQFIDINRPYEVKRYAYK